MENLKWKGTMYENEQRTFSLFETTEICLGSAKMDNFYQEKSYFTPGNNEEN